MLLSANQPHKRDSEGNVWSTSESTVNSRYSIFQCKRVIISGFALNVFLFTNFSVYMWCSRCVVLTQLHMKKREQILITSNSIRSGFCRLHIFLNPVHMTLCSVQKSDSGYNCFIPM